MLGCYLYSPICALLMTLGPSNPDPGLLQAVQKPAGGAHASPPAQDWRRHQKSSLGSQRKENGDLAKFGWQALLTSSLLLCACIMPTAVRDELQTCQLLTPSGFSGPHPYVILSQIKAESGLAFVPSEILILMDFQTKPKALPDSILMFPLR